MLMPAEAFGAEEMRESLFGAGGLVAEGAGEIALYFVAVHGVGLPPPCLLRNTLPHCARATLGCPCSFSPSPQGGGDRKLEVVRFASDYRVEPLFLATARLLSLLPSPQGGGDWNVENARKVWSVRITTIERTYKVMQTGLDSWRQAQVREEHGRS